MEAAETPVAKPSIWRGFWRYTLWWCLWLGLGSALMPVSSQEIAAYTFWGFKALQLGWGLAQGLLDSLIFTPLQNLLNPARKRPISWALVIGVWMVMKFVWLALQS